MSEPKVKSGLPQVWIVSGSRGAWYVDHYEEKRRYPQVFKTRRDASKKALEMNVADLERTSEIRDINLVDEN